MDPVLVKMLLTIFGYSACGSLVAVVLRFRQGNTPGPRLDQVAAYGALIGAGFGTLFAILQSMVNRL